MRKISNQFFFRIKWTFMLTVIWTVMHVGGRCSSGMTDKNMFHVCCVTVHVCCVTVQTDQVDCHADCYLDCHVYIDYVRATVGGHQWHAAMYRSGWSCGWFIRMWIRIWTESRFCSDCHAISYPNATITLIIFLQKVEITLIRVPIFAKVPITLIRIKHNNR